MVFLLRVNTYSYWKSQSSDNISFGYKLLSLQPFTFSSKDSIKIRRKNKSI